MARPNTTNVIRRSFCALFGAVSLSVVSLSATAAPLNLSLSQWDVRSGFIDVAYDASSGQLDANGFALEYDDDGFGGNNLLIDSGTFALQASVDSAGVLSGGSLSVGGSIAALGHNSGTLLTGTLTRLGFPDAGADPLEFLFTITGGDLADGLVGTSGGIILFGTDFTGDWTSNWSNDPFSGNADLAPVPVPPAVFLLGSALLGLMSAPRRKLMS